MPEAVETTVTISDRRGDRGENLRIMASFLRTYSRNEKIGGKTRKLFSDYADQLDKIAAEWIDMMAKSEVPDRIRSSLDDLKGQVDEIIAEID